MTYSIVARDEFTGELGVAVQSCMFAVGSVVPWAQPGVGAVATQAIVEPAYGPRCLERLAAGAAANEALGFAQAVDSAVGLRQVGVVSTDASVAAATGDLCTDHAGQALGDGFVVVANMMAAPAAWTAMASAFVESSGPLARRLLAALVAGEHAGGDARGCMSSALLVVDGDVPAQPAEGKVVDLRVDRSDDPIGDLARLLDAADAFTAFNQAVDQLVDGDSRSALQTIDGALLILPGDANLRFARAGALMALGATDEATSELRSLVDELPTWEVIVRSFVAKGLIRLPEGNSIDTVLG